MISDSTQPIRRQWLLAGRLNVLLSVAQMIIFVLLMLRSSAAYAWVNDVGLLIGFSINGVVAAVCLSRANRLTAPGAATSRP